MIDAKNITFFYDKEKTSLEVLKNININIKKGEFVAVLGHNGSGNPPLAKHFNAVLVPNEGVVEVEGLDTRDEKNLWHIRSKVAMVFQNPDNQIVATIVEDDVAFAAENLGVPSPEIRKRVEESLKSVDMYEFKDHAPHLLSGGQKQRIAIAGIIAMQPDAIVFDEPTAMLDPVGRSEVLKTILKLNKELNITIVLITHNMDEAVLADRVVVMDDGNVVIDDTPRNVFANVDLLKSIGLDVPQVTEIVWELKKSGLDVRCDILHVDECVEELYKLCR